MTSSKRPEFSDPFGDLLRDANSMSDEELERVMSGQASPLKPEDDPDQLEAGARVEGTVIDIRGGEVLVELGTKSVGVIDQEEFAEDFPAPGDKIRATFERHDEDRDVMVLSVSGVRRDVAWEELRPGVRTEGTVSAVNKGGLTLDLKGIRAFMPVSQVERGRVEDLEPYLGSKLRCEVLSVDRENHDVVVSRRAILDAEAEVVRERVFDTLMEGQVIQGRIARLTDFGAFVDLGGFDGLLASNKIRQRQDDEHPLEEGQTLQVQIVRIDREKQRVSLDFHQLPSDSWGAALEHYSVGDRVTGWVSAATDAGVLLSIEEGISGLLPAETFHVLTEPPRPGAILKAVVTSIDPGQRLLVLRPEPH